MTHKIFVAVSVASLYQPSVGGFSRLPWYFLGIATMPSTRFPLFEVSYRNEPHAEVWKYRLKDRGSIPLALKSFAINHLRRISDNGCDNTSAVFRQYSLGFTRICLLFFSRFFRLGYERPQAAKNQITAGPGRSPSHPASREFQLSVYARDS